MRNLRLKLLEPGDEMDFPIMASFFTGSPSCLQFSGTTSNFELSSCLYLISPKSSNCSLNRVRIFATFRIISYILSNHSDIQLKELENGIKNNISGNGCDLAESGTITAVKYRDRIINVVASLAGFGERKEEAGSFPVRLSYRIFSLSDEQVERVPRFWNQIKYGKCPEQFCWRDLGGFRFWAAPKMGELDDEASAHLLLFLLIPAATIAAYFLAHQLF